MLPESLLDLEALEQAPLNREPFQFVVVRDFLRPEALEAVTAAFPPIEGPGSFPLSRLRYGEAFARLVEELQGPAFRQAVERKFDLDLSGRPFMLTVRGWCRARDGQIHTDSRSKIVTALLYLNPRPWTAPGGRLRMLRSAEDLEDVIAEVPPEGGTLLMFRRSENSFHGHHPYEGPRRTLQMNWVTDRSVLDRELKRHGVSSWVKALNPFARAAGRRGEGR
ncbi:MAG: 2OG-Fe(II) oxygenase [Gammaproteobacteria bacterium]|nr:MAG: 2OG-Fe(II) oxygenase [Gammaproteobacteria bacterium]